MTQRELIPNLPPDSVFVADNAACSLHLSLLQLHSERAKTYWIWGHDSPPPHSDRMCKSELYSFISHISKHHPYSCHTCETWLHCPWLTAINAWFWL